MQPYRLLGIVLALASLVLTSAARGNSPSGTLLICGGGKLPPVIYHKFHELAGGDDARLVVIPTAGEKEPDVESIVEAWRGRGFVSVQVLHTRDRELADTPEFAEPLRQADAVWISGGQQSRLAKVYAGGPVERELQALVGRGGVIGGTSAGAAIQSRVMIASGNPDPKISTGFDLAPGVVIDQHFLVRNRVNRLLTALSQHPDKLGVGIDEGTAIEVHGHTATVLGESFAIVAKRSIDPPALSMESLSAGEKFELMDASAK